MNTRGFLCDEILTTAFLAMQEREPRGKRGTERASAVWYFLSLDAVLAKSDGEVAMLDLSPHTAHGQFQRQRFAAAFTDFVQVSRRPLAQIDSFGRVRSGGITPDKRVSANFLTTRLKAASEAASQRAYPSRPAPLIDLGVGPQRWSIQRHRDWRENLSVFFRDTRSRCPFTHLAMIVLRETAIDAGGDDAGSLIRPLRRLFSETLVDHWATRIQQERMFAGAQRVTLQEAPSSSLMSLRVEARLDASALRVRVQYLEGLLREQGVAFRETQQ